ncbi:MAG: hypothetical protein HXL16_02435 [Peptostreptococcaceae bacterium]|nr:hypothetical protein [Peptostreptococcaceae bacterium]
MEDLRDYRGYFYFYIEDINIYAKMEYKGIRNVDKITIDKDNEEAEKIKKTIAQNLKCDVSQVKRISKEEYMENNEEEE